MRRDPPHMMIEAINTMSNLDNTDNSKQVALVAPARRTITEYFAKRSPFSHWEKVRMRVPLLPSARMIFTCLGMLLLVVLQAERGNAQTYQVLYSFMGGIDGSSPRAGVVRDAAGNLYGTTEMGGAFGDGVVFKLDTANNETVLHSFAGSPSDGSQPWSPVTRDAAGNIYGTTYVGGQYELGTIFKLDPAGQQTILHHFGGITRNDGGAPFAGVLRDRSGNLYGTALEGGSGGWGVVFKLDATGQLTLLHDFRGDEGAQPHAGLVHDKAGNLYGAAEFGGTFDFGVVYRIGPTGNYSVLHSFDDQQGSLPYGGVIRDRAGNLYGTTVVGGAFHQGVVFKLAATGEYTVLHTFRTSDGAQPQSSLVRDSAGNLYGTTVLGGAAGAGVIFRVDSADNYTILHHFNGQDGEGPYGDLIRDSMGNLYGTTYEGGAFDHGVVFKLTP